MVEELREIIAQQDETIRCYRRRQFELSAQVAGLTAQLKLAESDLRGVRDQMNRMLDRIWDVGKEKRRG